MRAFLPQIVYSAGPGGGSAPLLGLRGQAVTVYRDAALTQVETALQLSPAGTPLADGRALLDATSRTPRLQVPGGEDVPTVLYAKPDGSSIATPIFSNAEEALAVLEGEIDQFFETANASFPNVVNVRKFGAKGDNVTDDTAAIQAAIDAAQLSGNPVYFPHGRYVVSDTLEVSYTSAASSTVRLVGDGAGTGVNPMTALRYTGAGVLLDIALSDFRMEGIDIEGLSFIGTNRTGTAIRIRKVLNAQNYNRHLRFTDLGFTLFNTCVEFIGYDTTEVLDLDNFYGPTHFDLINFYDVVCGVRLFYSVLNLCTFKRTLFHGTTAYAVDMEFSAPVLKFEDVHFEDCEPAALKIGAFQAGVTLDGVSAESTGNSTGLGLIDPDENGLTSHRLKLYVGHRNYPPVLMPVELRLPRDTEVWSNSTIRVAGEGIRIHTPDTVIPVVSDGEPFTYVLTPAHSPVTGPGNPAFTAPWGDKFNPQSHALPDGLRQDYVGSTGSIIDLTDTYTAPEAGFLYLTWLARAGYGSGGNDFGLGFEAADVFVGGAAVPVPLGTRYAAYDGFHTLIVPIAAGQAVTRLLLRQYTPEFTGPAAVSFVPARAFAVNTPAAPTDVLASQLTPARRVRRRDRLTLATGQSVEVLELGVFQQPSATRVTLTLNGGAGGVHSILTRSGGTNETRGEVVVGSSLATGVAVAARDFPEHAQMYGLKVTNTTGAPLTIDATVEYLT